MDDPIWDPTVFSHNRDRLLAGEIADKFFARVLEQARMKALLSDEHFTVDGTLIETWAGHKSFKAKGAERKTPPDDPGNPTVDFHGERRTHDTHQSSTDPDARLYKKAKGHEAKLSYLGHVLIENRNGLVVNTLVTYADGAAERDAALEMAREMQLSRRATLGADKNYDTGDFVRDLRELNVTPHVTQNTSRRSSAIDGRTTSHPGYAVSQRKRKRVEEVFRWLKTVGTLRKVRHRGLERVHWMFTCAAAAYNLVRMRNLQAAPARHSPRCLYLVHQDKRRNQNYEIRYQNRAERASTAIFALIDHLMFIFRAIFQRPAKCSRTITLLQERETDAILALC